MPARSRSADPREVELRLPRPPGVIRRFWTRHPVFADVLLALGSLLFSLTPAASFQAGDLDSDDPAGVVTIVTPSAAIDSALGAAIVSATVSLACAALLLRRRWPLLPFVLAIVAQASFLLAPLPAGAPVLVAAAYSVAVYRSSRAGWTAASIGAGSVGALAVMLMLNGVTTDSVALNTALSGGVLLLIGTSVGVNVGNRKRYIDALIGRSRQLLVERDQQARLAASAERTRIAREMHDIVSHSLTVIVALAEGAAATRDPERARAASRGAAETARGALTEMRAMLGVLRDADEDEGAPRLPDAPPDPHHLVATAQRAGYPVTLTTSGDAAGLSPVGRFALGRVVQEGLTNAMRHARGARSIRVAIAHSDEGADVTVDDDGVAGPAEGTGFGLRGLHERVSVAGGTFAAGPREGGGWRVHAEIPAAAAPSEEKKA
ncbi:sensor histidine kinase [Microbacterium sp. 18062]|uniref:sensor histidine kinase n=1 Tax=Microbacterium sp. 18062 TaxID=2681410 RepID=UPI00135CA722|nr:histidine kinase [Microbacterium sp. 18062]